MRRAGGSVGGRPGRHWEINREANDWAARHLPGADDDQPVAGRHHLRPGRVRPCAVPRARDAPVCAPVHRGDDRHVLRLDPDGSDRTKAGLPSRVRGGVRGGDRRDLGNRGRVVHALLPRQLPVRCLLRVRPVLPLRGGRARDGRLPQPGDLLRHCGRSGRGLGRTVDRDQHPSRRGRRGVRRQLRVDARAVPDERPHPRLHPVPGRGVRGGRERCAPAPCHRRPPARLRGGAARRGRRLRLDEPRDGRDPARHEGAGVHHRANCVRDPAAMPSACSRPPSSPAT